MQRQLQDETRNILVSGFGVSYIRDFMVVQIDYLKLLFSSFQELAKSKVSIACWFWMMHQSRAAPCTPLLWKNNWGLRRLPCRIDYHVFMWWTVEGRSFHYRWVIWLHWQWQWQWQWKIVYCQLPQKYMYITKSMVKHFTAMAKGAEALAYGPQQEYIYKYKSNIQYTDILTCTQYNK